jgi:hypothetical protein
MGSTLRWIGCNRRIDRRIFAYPPWRGPLGNYDKWIHAASESSLGEFHSPLRKFIRLRRGGRKPSHRSKPTIHTVGRADLCVVIRPVRAFDRRISNTPCRARGGHSGDLLAVDSLNNWHGFNEAAALPGRRGRPPPVISLRPQFSA